MLRTCKKVLSEARGIIYSRTFRVPEEETLLVWLHNIGPDNRRHLREIVLIRPSTCPDPVISVRQNSIMTRIAAVLDNSPNLKQIKVLYLGLDGMIDVKRLKLHRDGQASLLVTASRHMAEWMFAFFQPLLCSPSFRSRNPQRLSSLLVLDNLAYLVWCVFHDRRAGPCEPILKDEELDEAHASFSDHMELLLERSRKKNLRRRQKKLQRPT